MSTQQVVVIERVEGCTCSEVYLPSMQVGYCDAAGDWNECQHGSKVTVLDALSVECENCEGKGHNIEIDTEWNGISHEVEVTCRMCRGTGKRLATLDPPNGSAP